MTSICKPLKAFFDASLTKYSKDVFAYLVSTIFLLIYQLSEFVVIAPIDISELDGINLILEGVLLCHTQCVIILLLNARHLGDQRLLLEGLIRK